jgi:nucleoside-diphosphate-sugar epimerase
MRTLIVTGASGYIGRHLVEQARSSGWRVVAATRRRVEFADAWVRYRLDEEPVAEDFPSDAVIVHLAANTAATENAEIDIRAADRLIALARLRRGRLLFVSSQTARPDAPTPYGRFKWAIQQRVIDAGGTAIRPGLVYGGVPGGLYASLLRLVRERSVLPRFVPAPRVQPLHVDDLAQVLVSAAERSDLAGELLDVATLEPVAFHEFLRTLALARFGRAPRFVPVPGFVVPFATAALRAAGAETLAARVASLADLPPMNVAADIARLGVPLRSLAEGVQRHRPHRRALVAEATMMLHYMLGRRASLGTRRRYVTHVEQMSNGRAFEFPSLVRAWPAALRALDQRAWLRNHTSLDWRFGIALTIAEASREGASRFIADARPANAALAIVRIAATGLLEAIARIGGVLLRAAMRTRLG